MGSANRPPPQCVSPASTMRKLDRFVTVSGRLGRDEETRRWYSDDAGACLVLTRRGRLLEPHPVFGPTSYRLLAVHTSLADAHAFASTHGLRHTRVLPPLRLPR